MMAMKQHLSWILMAGLATAHLVGSAEPSSPAAPMPEAGLTREQRIQWWPRPGSACSSLCSGKAGMRYMVLTTKHHDGFSMFRSRLTPYNVADATPFKRDVTRELSDACRDSGIRFGCYYSIDRDWYRPQGPGNNYKQNNVWDFPDSKPDQGPYPD